MVKLEVIIPPIKTERRQITDGKTGGDKHTIKQTETTGTTDCITRVDKPSNKKTETREITDDQTGGDKNTIEKTETTGTTDGKTRGDKPSN